MSGFRERQGNWSKGVVSAGRPDKIPDDAAFAGTNAALAYVTSNPPVAVPQKRLGCSVQTAAAETGTPAILGLGWFRRRSGASYTDYSLAISDGGRLSKIVSSAWVSADSGTAAPFTSGTKLPSMETMNNLFFMVNGTNQKKFDGTDVTAFGITRPATPTEAVTGTSGSP